MSAKARVLVVDDDVSTRETYSAILRLAGYDAESASTGREALTLIDVEKRSFHLLFVDLRLPDMSGLEVLASVGVVTRTCRSHGFPRGRPTAPARQLGADFLEKAVVEVPVDAVGPT